MKKEDLRTYIQSLPQGEWQDLLSWIVNDERNRRKGVAAGYEAALSAYETVWKAQPSLKPKFSESVDLGEKKGASKKDVVDSFPRFDKDAFYPLGAVVAYKQDVWTKEEVDTAVPASAPDADGSGWNKVTDDAIASAKGAEVSEETEDEQDN